MSWKMAEKETTSFGKPGVISIRLKQKMSWKSNSTLMIMLDIVSVAQKHRLYLLSLL